MSKLTFKNCGTFRIAILSNIKSDFFVWAVIIYLLLSKTGKKKGQKESTELFLKDASHQLVLLPS